MELKWNQMQSCFYQYIHWQKIILKWLIFKGWIKLGLPENFEHWVNLNNSLLEKQKKSYNIKRNLKWFLWAGDKLGCEFSVR